MKANHKAVFLNDEHASVGMALGAVIALLVSILVGILIYYKIAASSSTSFTANTAADRATRLLLNGTNTTSGTVFTLSPIIGIVMIAGIILAIVTRFGQGPSV
jgi:hypothetical protein